MLLDIKQSSILTAHCVENVFKCSFKTLIRRKTKEIRSAAPRVLYRIKHTYSCFQYYIKAQLSQESSPRILLSDTISCSRICISTLERGTVKTRNTGISQNFTECPGMYIMQFLWNIPEFLKYIENIQIFELQDKQEKKKL